MDASTVVQLITGILVTAVVAPLIALLGWAVKQLLTQTVPDLTKAAVTQVQALTLEQAALRKDFKDAMVGDRELFQKELSKAREEFRDANASLRQDFLRAQDETRTRFAKVDTTLALQNEALENILDIMGKARSREQEHLDKEAAQQAAFLDDIRRSLRKGPQDATPGEGTTH